jgi:DMSO/TMAO reductase YedYZ heme-binding membrane subunit
VSRATVVRRLVGLFGVVALATGLWVFFGGAEAGTGAGPVNANVDTEYRFFAAFWIAAGACALYLAVKDRITRTALALITGTLFLGGVGRILSWVDEGRPDTTFVVLMAIELAAPLLLLLRHDRLG